MRLCIPTWGRWVLAVIVLFLFLVRVGACLYQQSPRSSKPKSAASVLKEVPPPFVPRLTRTILDASLDLGRSYLLNSQRKAGNFIYEFDFVSEKEIPGDSQVRQAGSAWGLALIHQDRPSVDVARAVGDALAFFRKHSRVTEDGRRYVVYPNERVGSTGTMALVVLAHIDFLRSDGDIPNRKQLTADRDAYLRFLLSLRMPDGHFHQRYSIEDGAGKGGSSPYFDGESLLAMARAARYSGYHALKDVVLESAEVMHRDFVERALARDPDSATTKGFYQWGTMSFYEIFGADWSGTEVWAKRSIALAHWMIDVHHTLTRRRNTAYAQEGIITAWELARLTNDAAAQETFARVVDRGLFKLSTWQVDSKIANRFLRQHPTDDPRAVGGVMNAKNDPVLRIDVTQHQMHAVILARRFIYRGEDT